MFQLIQILQLYDVKKRQLLKTPLHRHLLVMSTHMSPTPARQACTLLVAWRSTQLSVWRVDDGPTHQRHAVVTHYSYTCITNNTTCTCNWMVYAVVIDLDIG